MMGEIVLCQNLFLNIGNNSTKGRYAVVSWSMLVLGNMWWLRTWVMRHSVLP